MIKILVSSALKQDSTSFYRAYGVFPNLARQLGGDLIITDFTTRGMTWADLASFDILFLQRPYHPSLLDLATYARQLGVKIWVDYDDNLFELPIEHKAFAMYSDPQVRKAMIGMLTLADVVTVSTNQLATTFKEMGVTSPIKVVPNALNDDFFTLADHCNFDSSVIAWRGSDTHFFDLAEYTEGLIKGITATPGTTWHFFGMLPIFLAKAVDNKRLAVSVPEDPIVYHFKFKKIAPRVMHVPLGDNPLNRSKSNIAWIEATFAGAVCIAPDWPEWRRPGIINYTSHEHFGNLLANLPDASDLRSLWQQSRDYITENLLLTRVNAQRVAIVEELLSAPRHQPEKEPFKLRVQRMQREEALDKISPP